MKLNLKERKKQEKGITLIALVVTVIILLILAGVSFIMLTGEDSVIEKARKAKNLHNSATAIEDVSLAWTEAEVEYQTRKSESDTKTTYFTKENINSKLSAGKISDEDGSFVYVENGISKVVYINEQNETYIIEIDQNGVALVVQDSQIIEGENVISTKHTYSMTKGSTYQIEAEEELTWETDNTDIVELKTEGTKVTITGLSVGSATVKGKTESGKDVIECYITVDDIKEEKEWRYVTGNIPVTSLYYYSSPTSDTKKRIEPDTKTNFTYKSYWDEYNVYYDNGTIYSEQAINTGLEHIEEIMIKANGQFALSWR